MIGWWGVTQNVWQTDSLTELEMAVNAWVAFATKNWLVWAHSNFAARCLLNYHRSIPTTKKNILVYLASLIVRSLNVFNTFVASLPACSRSLSNNCWLQCSICLTRELATFPPILAWLAVSLCYWLYFLTICSFLTMDCFRKEILTS